MPRNLWNIFRDLVREVKVRNAGQAIAMAEHSELVAYLQNAVPKISAELTGKGTAAIGGAFGATVRVSALVKRL